MKLKQKIIYLLIYLVLACTSVYIAMQFWWTDYLTLSYLNRQVIALLGSVGLMWVGIVFLSIFIVRLLFLKEEKGFITPLNFIDEDFIKRRGLVYAKKVKYWFIGIAFGVLFLSISLFRYCMSIYKDNQLTANGVTQMVTVHEIKSDAQNNQYAHFKYYYNGQEYETNLPLNQLKQGDRTEIVFSKDNPDIVDYRTTYSKE